MSGAVSIEPLRQAFEDVTAAKREVATSRARLGELQATESQNEHDIEIMSAEKLEEDASRIVDGDHAVPKKPRRDNKLAKLKEEQPAILAAITLQERRVKAAEAAVGPLRAALALPSLHLVAEVQGSALDEIRTALASLSAPARRLIAADQILAGLLGTSGFPIPAGAPVPINGSRLLSGLLKAIPDNVRPADLTPDDLFAEARAISQPILAEIKGEPTS